MIKQIAWNTFKKTGDINTYLELKQVTNIEQNMQEKVKKYEINKNERNSNFIFFHLFLHILFYICYLF